MKNYVAIICENLGGAEPFIKIVQAKANSMQQFTEVVEEKMSKQHYIKELYVVTNNKLLEADYQKGERRMNKKELEERIAYLEKVIGLMLDVLAIAKCATNIS